MPQSRTKRKRVALVTKFAFIIGVSIFYSVFFITAYNIYASSPIVEQYKLDKENEINAISNIVHTEYKKMFFGGERFCQNFSELINNLQENELVLNVEVWDQGTGELVWISDTKDIKEVENKDNIIIKKFESDDKTLIIRFFRDESLLNLVKVLKDGNYMLAATFIIFGFLSASLLARQVTKPIEQLVIGVWEFSKGNLDYRTPIKTDDEIGILAKAFNYMAEKLNDLYSSLELKVKERTAELSKAYEDLKETQSLLVHNEKMKSLGELVAGVAHELNNPINFIYGNMTHLKSYSDDLIEIISRYEELEKKYPDIDFSKIDELKKEIDYEFLKEDIASLIKSCKDGAERSKNIVIQLKDFSRLDQGIVKEIDVNESIDSTLNILSNKYRDKIEVVRKYGEIPMLNCYAGQLNQVFMNILDNAGQAIKESGTVYIRTMVEDNTMVIEFEDTGEGMDEETIPKIFDPFFTTKEVGSGTGLGLSTSYKIVKSHNGVIEVESEKGKGTKFRIKIPLDWEKQNMETKA